jgi:hypothetical protein
VFLSCGEAIAPVQRQVAASPAVLRAALEELLRGPTPDEARAGFHSFFSTETAGMLESVVVGADGVARISFRDFSALIPNASSSGQPAAARSAACDDLPVSVRARSEPLVRRRLRGVLELVAAGLRAAAPGTPVSP